MTKHWRALSVSLLSLIAILTVSTAVAQAKWLLLKELFPPAVESFSSISLELFTEGIYLLSENGSKIQCGKGPYGVASPGTLIESLSEENKTLSGSIALTFSECVELGFSGTCTIHGPEQGIGKVVLSGNTVSGMSGEEVFTKAESAHLAEIIYEGAKCPLNEAEEPLSGGLKIVTLEPLKLQVSHQIHLLGESLKLGTSKAEIHMLDPKTKKTLSLILGEDRDSHLSRVGLHLVNL